MDELRNLLRYGPGEDTRPWWLLEPISSNYTFITRYDDEHSILCLIDDSLIRINKRFVGATFKNEIERFADRIGRRSVRVKLNPDHFSKVLGNSHEVAIPNWKIEHREEIIPVNPNVPMDVFQSISETQQQYYRALRNQVNRNQSLYWGGAELQSGGVRIDEIMF